MSVPGPREHEPIGQPRHGAARTADPSYDGGRPAGGNRPEFVPDPAMSVPRQGGPRNTGPAFTATAAGDVPAASPTTGTATATTASPTAPEKPRVIDATGQTVRPARFDRPLGAHYLPTYADPELERIVREAADDAREQARAEGYARGWAQGREAAAKAAAEEDARRRHTVAARERIEAKRITSALNAAVAAARDVGSVNAPQWNEVADALLDAAMDLTRAVLARECTAMGGEVVDAVRLALRGIADGAPVIAVNPEDYDTLTELAGSGSIPDDVHFVADRDVPRGAALARAGARQLFAHLPSALAAAEEVLCG